MEIPYRREITLWVPRSAVSVSTTSHSLFPIRYSLLPLYLYMRNLIFSTLCLGFIISLTLGLTDNFSYVQQNSSVSSHSNNSNGNEKTFKSLTSQQSNSSSFQKSTLNLQAANLQNPHVLKINSTGTQLQGKISINGKVVKQLNNNQSEFNLSPYLSVGQQKVEISANYTPPSAAVNVEVNGSGNNISQQTGGNGSLNYKLDLIIQ